MQVEEVRTWIWTHSSHHWILQGINKIIGNHSNEYLDIFLRLHSTTSNWKPNFVLEGSQRLKLQEPLESRLLLGLLLNRTISTYLCLEVLKRSQDLLEGPYAIITRSWIQECCKVFCLLHPPSLTNSHSEREPSLSKKTWSASLKVHGTGYKVQEHCIFAQWGMLRL